MYQTQLCLNVQTKHNIYRNSNFNHRNKKLVKKKHDNRVRESRDKKEKRRIIRRRDNRRGREPPLRRLAAQYQYSMQEMSTDHIFYWRSYPSCFPFDPPLQSGQILVCGICPYVGNWACLILQTKKDR